MWIKICGMTTPEAIQAALDAGVDALGFVFAPSPRLLTPLQAARLALPARAHARCVAVTLHPEQDQVDAILRLFEPDVLQSELGDFERLRLPAGLARLPVARARAAVGGDALPPRLLFEGPRSGSGTISDWPQAAALARRCELVLAGGLDAANVGTAIATVQPFGVDVSSGVEDAPGIKSPAKIREFVRAARAAFRENEHEYHRTSRGS
jgi:phosphoribosylanthranilate isomerase